MKSRINIIDIILIFLVFIAVVLLCWGFYNYTTYGKIVNLNYHNNYEFPLCDNKTLIIKLYKVLGKDEVKIDLKTIENI